MKGRTKNPIPSPVRRFADAVIEDNLSGEPTLLRVLEAGAARMVHWMSASVVEAAIARVPSVCLAPPRGVWSAYDARRHRLPDFEPLLPGSHGGFWGGWGDAVRGLDYRDAVRDGFGDALAPEHPLEPTLGRYREMLLGEPGAGKRIEVYAGQVCP